MGDGFDKFNEGVTASMQAFEEREAGNVDAADALHEQAVAFFDQAIAAGVAHGGAYGGKGMSLSQLGRTQEAIAAFEAAVAIEPFAEFYRQLGLCHVELGDMQPAWDYTRKAVTCDDSSEFRSRAAAELTSFGRNILYISEANASEMTAEQQVAYHRWAASAFALAHDTDDGHTEAATLLQKVEEKLNQM